ncbi:hypothetical protein ACERZ8_13120 [Tateyamaria armeniaca]|uniref:Uncharacterized protein n=1 Tax=Tateyamaria armeniaca TaxID=2518930 RepID=A0ABW8UUJ7_9RHOB
MPISGAAQTVMLGQSYPSGAIYMMAPDGDDIQWPDTISLMPLRDDAQGADARLDRIARDVHPLRPKTHPPPGGAAGGKVRL